MSCSIYPEKGATLRSIKTEKGATLREQPQDREGASNLYDETEGGAAGQRRGQH